MKRKVGKELGDSFSPIGMSLLFLCCCVVCFEVNSYIFSFIERCFHFSIFHFGLFPTLQLTQVLLSIHVMHLQWRYRLPSRLWLLLCYCGLSDIFLGELSVYTCYMVIENSLECIDGDCALGSIILQICWEHIN